MLPLFKDMIRARKGTLVDLGCGTGRAGLALSELGFQVTLMDFAGNAIDSQIDGKLPFVDRDLCGWWPPKEHWDWGYCCDVMEHLPPEQVCPVLERITAHCSNVFFTIHFGPDHFGELIGHPLHLTVQPFAWWRGVLKIYGELIEARDLMGMGVFRLRSAT